MSKDDCKPNITFKNNSLERKKHERGVHVLFIIFFFRFFRFFHLFFRFFQTGIHFLKFLHLQIVWGFFVVVVVFCFLF